MCRHDGEGAEDVELGKCMENLHVQAGDSRDSLGRGRFFPFVPEHHLIPGLVGKDFWYWKYIYYPTEEVSICKCYLSPTINDRFKIVEILSAIFEERFCEYTQLQTT